MPWRRRSARRRSSDSPCTACLQGRPHVLMDMRIVGDAGEELPWDGKAFGNLQVRAVAAGWRRAAPPSFRRGTRALRPGPASNLAALRWPQLQVRGAATISRYYGSDAAGADAEGFFDTGDVATIDPQGHMQVRTHAAGVEQVLVAVIMAAARSWRCPSRLPQPAHLTRRCPANNGTHPPPLPLAPSQSPPDHRPIQGRDQERRRVDLLHRGGEPRGRAPPGRGCAGGGLPPVPPHARCPAACGTAGCPCTGRSSTPTSSRLRAAAPCPIRAQRPR